MPDVRPDITRANAEELVKIRALKTIGEAFARGAETVTLDLRTGDRTTPALAKDD